MTIGKLKETFYENLNCKVNIEKCECRVIINVGIIKGSMQVQLFQILCDIDSE
jgi:flagellar biosynthesis/type III secretory pathway protein FliH